MKYFAPLSSLALVLSLGACASAPPPVQVPVEEPRVIQEKPLLNLPGETVPEAYARAFSDFLEEDVAKVYQRVVEVSEISNALELVVERRVESEGMCQVGPSVVSFVQKDDGTLAREVAHFGDDCCPGTVCLMLPSSWNLRYINAVKSKDLAALAALVPAKKKLKYNFVGATESGTEKSKKQFSRKDVAAGKFTNPPGCGFINLQPSCGEPDAKGKFQCRCDGGGYHVTYDWEKEGDTFVIVAISEESS